MGGGQAPGVPVQLLGVGKTFADGTRALEPVDLSIAGGEIVVFLGPSGCGKTTLLRLIAGLETPDAGGRILFGGEDVTATPIEHRQVGMVFQSYALFPNMTVRGNVAYGLKVRATPVRVRQQRVEETLALMRITDLADRSIEQLSGGQRQRVALARAIAVRPRVLLLDEPLTALDAQLRDTLRLEIHQLLRSLGITAVFVTHDQAEAMELGDRIVVMRKGQVAQVGGPRDIYYHPADAFVADFIGTMNRLPGGEGGAPVLVRPQDLVLGRRGSGQYQGMVEQSVFLGDRVRVTVRLSEGSLLIADVPDRDPPRPGNSVGVDFATERAVVLR